MQTARRRRWVVVCLVVYVLAVVVVVFAPASYSQIVNGIALWLRGELGVTFFGSGWIEFGANIAMFLPLGLLLTLLFRHPWHGTVLAVLMSVTVEMGQMVIPDRQATLRDVVSNSIGAAIGAFLAWVIVLRPRIGSPPGRMREE